MKKRTHLFRPSVWLWLLLPPSLFALSSFVWALPQSPPRRFHKGLYFSDSKDKNAYHLFSFSFSPQSHARIVHQEDSLQIFLDLLLDTSAQRELETLLSKQAANLQVISQPWLKNLSARLLDSTSALQPLPLSSSSVSIRSLTLTAKVEDHALKIAWFQALKTRQKDLSLSLELAAEAVAPPSHIKITFYPQKINELLRSLSASPQRPSGSKPSERDLYLWLKILLQKQAIVVKRDRAQIPPSTFDALQSPNKNAPTIEFSGTYRPSFLSRFRPKTDAFLEAVAQHILRSWLPLLSPQALTSPQVSKPPTPPVRSASSVLPLFYWHTTDAKKRQSFQTSTSVQEDKKDLVSHPLQRPWSAFFGSCEKCIFFP